MSVIFGPGVGLPPPNSPPDTLSDNSLNDLLPVVVQVVPGQTGNLLEFRDTAGALLSAVDVSGALSGGGLGAAVLLAPATAGRNTVQPTADVGDLTLRPFANGQVSPVFNIQDSAGAADLIRVTAAGDLYQFDSNGTQTLFAPAAGGISISPGSDTQDCLSILPWSNTAGDTLIIRNGSLAAVLQITAAGAIGAFGAPPAGQQANGTAADLAAIADAPAKAFITALSTALVNLGFLSAPA